MIEEDILRFFYEKTKKSGPRETTTGLVHDFHREHKDIERNDIEEAITILISQKYLTEKNVTTKFDPKIYNKFSKERVQTIRTTYIELSGKALLHLKGREENNVATTALFDSSQPYAVRRKLENIFENAKSQIRIADNYIGRKTLDYLQVATVPVQIITSSKEEKNFSLALNDFEAQYPSSIEIKIVDNKLHGRFVIADDKYFVLDHSIKDFGDKPSTIVEVIDLPVQTAYKKLFDDNWKN